MKIYPKQNMITLHTTFPMALTIFFLFAPMCALLPMSKRDEQIRNMIAERVIIMILGGVKRAIPIKRLNAFHFLTLGRNG